jgi:D-amino peptidase
MTNEVLAAIAACDAAGAAEYVITDGHGSAHNLLIDSFPDHSRLIRSWPRPLLQMEAIDQGHYDAAIFIGHHASATMAGGILAHSFTGTFADIRLNGVSQSETSLNVLLAGHYGVPVIFTSGDDCYIAHCQERLPGIETVITKRAIGYSSAESLTPVAS